MSGLVTPEGFTKALPGYVEHAYAATAALIDRAIANPGLQIQLRATIRNRTPPDFREHTTDPERLAQVWETKEGLDTIEADAPIDLGRLAIESGIGGLRLWVYAPPVAEDGDDWIASGARANVANLASPGYVFSNDRIVVDDEPDSRYGIMAYACTPSDERHDWRFNSAAGVENYPPAYFRDAIAPPCSAMDRKLLDYNIQSYHAAKIGTLLLVLDNIGR